jgi:SAM-dependent methyltransferase
LGALKRLALRLLGRARLLGPAFRAYERLQALRSRDEPSSDDGLPVPPARLRVRVAWTGDAAWFLESGRRAEQAIRAALARQGTAPEELGALLDFGCGCGRVTRRWLGLRGVDVAGSDTSEEAVEWCRRNLPFARFELNGLAPPLAFDDGSFDLVYALSVFTHLPVELQLDWMRELHRVLRPDGLLLLTTHGAAYADGLTADERSRFERGEIVVRREEVAGTNLCSTFHPEAALRGRLAAGFAFVEHRPEGAEGNPRQDQTLLRKA